MSLKSHGLEPIPEETRRLVERLCPKGTTVTQLRDALGPIYSDAHFAHLFPKRGRAAEAPWRLALVTVLQAIEGLTDRQAAEAVRTRIDWLYALALPLENRSGSYNRSPDHPGARPGHTASQCACAPPQLLGDRSTPRWLATPSPAPAATGLLPPVPVWETGGQSVHRYRWDQGHHATASPSCLWGTGARPADAFLQGWAPSHGISATWVTSFRVPTGEAICLPLATLSFSEVYQMGLVHLSGQNFPTESSIGSLRGITSS